MSFTRQNYNPEAFQDVFETAARMPFDWGQVVGFLLGDRSVLPGRFGGSCYNQSMYVVKNLPKGYGTLTSDHGYRHFGVLVGGKHHFEPTFYQSSIIPDRTADRGNYNVYPTLIRGGSVSVQRTGNEFEESISFLNNSYSMSKVGIPEGVAANYAYQGIANKIQTPPFILFPTADGFEATVRYDPTYDGLTLSARYGPINIDENQILSEMEQTYGFSADDLVSYFAQSWKRVRRQVNID